MRRHPRCQASACARDLSARTAVAAAPPMRRNCAADGGASVPSAGWAPVDDGGRPDAAPPETPASVGGELPGPVGVPEGAATVETADEPTPLGGGVADGPLPNAPPAAP